MSDADIIDLNAVRSTRLEQRRQEETTSAIEVIAALSRRPREYTRKPGNLWTWPIDEWPDPTSTDDNGAA